MSELLCVLSFLVKFVGVNAYNLSVKLYYTFPLGLYMLRGKGKLHREKGIIHFQETKHLISDQVTYIFRDTKIEHRDYIFRHMFSFSILICEIAFYESMLELLVFRVGKVICQGVACQAD